MPDVSYSRVNWTDSPSTTTPLNAENLNKMDKGIHDCATEINLLRQNDVKKFSDSSYQTVDSIAYNPTTSELGLKVNGADTVIPFTKKNTETYPSESTDITANGTYDMGENNNYRNVRVNVPKWVKIKSATQSTTINVLSYTGGTFVFVPVESHTIQASSGYQFIYTNGSLSRSGNTLTFTAPNMKFQSSGGWADSYNIKCDIYWLAPY